MSLFVVDREKCTADGICAAVCPPEIITMHESGPKSVESMEQYCIHCGHCVAVCPHGALSLNTTPVEECSPLRQGWKLNPEQVEQFLKGRRSIRAYTAQTIEPDVLKQMIDMARFAPSGNNRQPLDWLVVRDPAEVKHLAGLVIEWMRSQIDAQSPLVQAFGMEGLVGDWDSGSDRILRGAPHLIVVHAPKDNQTAISAGTIALSYLELAALPFGAGTCWAGYFQAASKMSPSLQDSLQLPEDHQCFGAMMIGYPKFEYHRMPLRNEVQIAWR